MNTFIRTSNIDTAFYIRKLLWENIYSKFEYIDFLIKSIGGGFYNTCNIEFNPMNMTIILKSKGRPFDKENINQIILKSYKEFIQVLYTKGSIDNDVYNKCNSEANKLFFITFDNNHVIKIHL